MKTKLTLIFCILCLNAFGQGWYRNLEKYWWYRYRLVNDFMKVGPDCGESIPADYRRIGSEGKLDWGDATQYLGHYMALLGTEYKLLKSSGYDTKRTDYETDMALTAFNRLDRYAEWLCEDIHLNNNKPCDLGEPPGWHSNGFFIRDDVYGPPIGVLNTSAGFVFDNFKHFNRPGIKDRSTVSYVSSGFSNRSKLTIYEWNATHPYTSDRQYPQEGNQDQMSELFAGMALIIACGDGGTSTNNLNINSSKGAIQRMMTWAITPGIWTFPYQLTNPLTGKCVYGTREFLPACNSGGADMMAASPGAARASIKLLGTSPTTNAYYSISWIYEPAYQIIGKLCHSAGTGEFMHADNYAAIARDIYWSPLIPYPPYLPPPPVTNITWPRLKCKSYASDFSTPHIPLIYKIHNPGSLDLDKPKKCLCSMSQPDYAGLLNKSIFCGNWAKSKTEYGDYQWSCPDRLGHFFGRGDFDDGPADFNGIDYMKLFNLYSIVRKDYLQWMINPFYEENFDETYPQYTSITTFGSHDHPLKLNYLEYLSAVNTIQPNGHLTFRGAKIIELLPGFDAQTGSYFEAYIQDYDCHKDDYCYAQHSVKHLQQDYYVYTPYSCLNPYNPHPNRRMALRMDIDSVVAYEDMLADSFLESFSSKGLLSEMSEEDYLHLLDSLTQVAQLVEWHKEHRQKTFEVNISPNPAANILNVATNEADDYQINILDVHGKSLLNFQFQQEAYFSLDVSALPAGLYFLRVAGRKNRNNQKITILK